jgi:hypothetical protein
MAIVDAEDKYGHAYRLAGLPRERLAEHVIHYHWQHGDVQAFVPVATAVAVHVKAEVNDGRWIVRCPSCLSAALAAKADRRFFCAECLNTRHQRMWLTVDWPEQVALIEALLDVRPSVDDRCWLPTDTISDLAEWNTDRGLPVPDEARNG